MRAADPARGARPERSSPPLQDPATRERLLETAIGLFAERGFSQVSVRDICRAAKANVAAVNYHFGSKLGLYTEVVDRAIATMQTTSDVTMHAEGSPADKLRHYVRTFLDRLVSPGRPAWIHRLVEHEMSQPTPAAGRIVERAIRPRIQYLTGIVSELLACAADDPRVRRSVVSLQGQCLFHARLLQAADPFREIGFPQWPRDTTLELEAVADHVAEFSLAGIRGIGGVDGEP